MARSSAISIVAVVFLLFSVAWGQVVITTPKPPSGISFLPPICHAVKEGAWTDPAVWKCSSAPTQRIPLPTDWVSVLYANPCEICETTALSSFLVNAIGRAEQ